MHTEATAALRAARQFLFDHADDYDTVVRDFVWPRPKRFNWATEWFDELAAEHPDRPALTIVEQDGSTRSVSYGEMAARSVRTAGWLAELGVRSGDRVLLMLGNQVELWEIILACIRLGAVMIPAATLLSPADLDDRIARGQARVVVARSGDTGSFRSGADDLLRIAVGDPVPHWVCFTDRESWSGAPAPEASLPAGDPLLLYFTSGTTAQPKLVEHSQISYPIGHLSTLYWIGLRPGDVHLNISSPGWAKHAWSCVFAPWLAGATVFMYNYARFDAAALMRVMAEHGVTTFCAPPTVWRMLIQADLSALATPPREAVGAGEPLNPEVIEQVRQAWGLTVRDGFGQTEMSLAIGNSPGQRVKDGSMGRPMPGYRVVLIDPITGEPAGEGEICVDLADRPVPVLTAYHGDAERSAQATADGLYHTGDVGSVDDDGYITYVGRSDDVFKASDYRISPFELESVLLEHESVAEAAVVPAPDALRLAVPKAYIVLVSGVEPGPDTARSIFAYTRAHLAPYKRIRRLEFAELPKTISGKIRRVELRERENAGGRPEGEYREDELG